MHSVIHINYRVILRKCKVIQIFKKFRSEMLMICTLLVNKEKSLKVWAAFKNYRMAFHNSGTQKILVQPNTNAGFYSF